MNWHRGYTIILILIGATVGYEMFAVYTQLSGFLTWPTISESVWNLTGAWPWLKFVGTVTFAILVLHFWWGLWGRKS